MTEPKGELTRRGFLRGGLATALGITGAGAVARAGAQAETASTAIPWYRRAYRWGQTNITEKDPVRYDIAWWREYWKRTEVQGVIINAGGIVAYYPSKFPLHHRAEFLGGRDLFGELTQGRAQRRALRAGAHGLQPRRRGLLPGASRLVRARRERARLPRRATSTSPASTAPTTTSTSPACSARSSSARIPKASPTTVGRPGPRQHLLLRQLRARFRERRAGTPLPAAADWDDPAYRAVDQWNYARRARVWELNNRVTRAAGGPRLHLGRHEQRVDHQPARSFRDLQGDLRPRRHHDARPPARDDDTASSRTATPASSCTACWAGTSWRPRAWRCTRSGRATSAWRASRPPRRACG